MAATGSKACTNREPRLQRVKSAREPFRSMRLLVLEADQGRCREFERVLSQRGHVASIVSTGHAGLRMALAEDFDAVVVNTELPDADGLQILKMIRAVSDSPVVATMTSDRSMESDVVAADDYLVEPYTADELEFRVRMLARRLAEIGGLRSNMTLGDLTIDQIARDAYLGDTRLELSRKEFDLLAYLVSKHGEVLSKRELAENVWGDPYGGSDRTVDVHLSWLRRKLGESAARPRYLRTVRGVGVKVVDPRTAGRC